MNMEVWKMPKFVKKPVVVDAIQFTGDNLVELSEFMNKRALHFNSEKKEIIIETLEGNHIASKGDWIIKGVKGEFYPCKPDIFQMTYTPINDKEEM